MSVNDSALRLQSLASMAQALAAPAPLNELLETAAEEARSALRAASVSISRVDPAEGVVRTVINVGDLGPDEVRWPEDEVYSISEVSRLDEAIRGMKTWTEQVDDPGCDPYERELMQRLGKGSALATPVLVGGVAWGEFYMTRHRGDWEFGVEAIAYAEVLAAMLGAAIDRSQREAVLEGIARRDPLTGLSNRRDLDEQAARMFAGDGHDRTVTVISFDINGLKAVNDSHGHARGDLLIRSVGQALADGFGDLAEVCVARVGGDEFTVLVAGHPFDDLELRVNLVCSMTWAADPHAGVSAGMATARPGRASNPGPSALFAEADRAQYEAKRSGSRTAVLSRESWQDPGHAL